MSAAVVTSGGVAGLENSETNLADKQATLDSNGKVEGKESVDDRLLTIEERRQLISKINEKIQTTYDEIKNINLLDEDGANLEAFITTI